MTRPISVYREFAPCAALGEYVRALAWYGPADSPVGARTPTREFYILSDGQLTPSFADAQTSLIFPLGLSFGARGWEECSTRDAVALGSMTRATQPPNGDRLAMIGVYLRPLGCGTILGLPATELTDRTVSLADLSRRFAIAPDLMTLENVEALLVRQLSREPPDRAKYITTLASHATRCGGRISVADMADLAGMSRQNLARLFPQYIGVGPKLFLRLARFRGALRHLRDGALLDSWSGFAARLGYSDQSHFIRDFREFTSFTPQQLARGDRFHPFIGAD